MRLRVLPLRSFGQSIEWVDAVGATRGGNVVRPAVEHADPVLDHVLHAEGVKGDMLPLEDDDGAIGKGVDAQAEDGSVDGQVVADAAGSVAGLPGQRGEIIWVGEDGGADEAGGGGA